MDWENGEWYVYKLAEKNASTHPLQRVALLRPTREPKQRFHALGRGCYAWGRAELARPQPRPRALGQNHIGRKGRAVVCVFICVMTGVAGSGHR